MATSSITKNFVVSGKKQVEIFADAIEKSYQDSLTRKPSTIKFNFTTPKEICEAKKQKKKATYQCPK